VSTGVAIEFRKSSPGASATKMAGIAVFMNSL
jgi:hypothetical protein